MPQLDTGDFETCPVGTMDAMTGAAVALTRWIDDGNMHPSIGDAHALRACRDILTAHRERMGTVIIPGGTDITMVNGEMVQTPRAPRPALKESLTTATPEPDYTSETEDLTTWPETRGKEWRIMGSREIRRKGDVQHFRNNRTFDWIDGLNGCAVGDAEAWTRRPKPQEAP